MVMLFLFSIASLADYFILSIQSIEFCWQGYDLVFLLELLLNVFYLLYFSLRFLAAPDTLRFWLEMNSMVDFFTVPPSLASLFTQRSWLGLRFLRALHLTELPTILQFLNILQTSSSLKLARLVAVFLAYCLTAAGFIHLVENSGDPWWTVPNSQPLTYFQSVYFLMVTMSTVGYGDVLVHTVLGRVFIIFIITTGLALFASYIPEIVEIVGKRRKHDGSYTPLPGKKHVVVCGHLTLTNLTAFLKEFLHEDRGVVSVKVVLLGNFDPDAQFELFLKRNFIKTVFYQGSVLSSRDLARVQMQKADACLVLSNKFCKDPHTEDACNIMRVISIKDYCADTRVICTMLQNPSKVYLQNIPSWDCHLGDAVICLAELKLGFMAQGCMVPGLSTLLANLFTMQSPAQTQPGSWRSHYMLGLYNEVYTEELSRDFTGLDPFEMSLCQTHVSRLVSSRLSSPHRLCFVKLRVLLIGIEYRTAKECSILVNPQSDLTIPEKTLGFFIASNVFDVKRASLFCFACHSDITEPSKITECSCHTLQHSDKVGVPLEDPLDRVRSFGVISCPEHKERDDPQTHPAWEVKAQLDSTGMFHWCPPVPLESVTLSRSAARCLPLQDHVLVCVFGDEHSPLLGLRNLVMPLRAGNLTGTELHTVLLLGSLQYLQREWEHIHYFPRIYILPGSPLCRADLRAAQVSQCASCLILSTCCDSSLEPSLQDKESVLASLNIQSMQFPDSRPDSSLAGSPHPGADDTKPPFRQSGLRVPVVADLVHSSNVQYMSSLDSLETSFSDLHLTQAFASGSIFSVGVLDSLVSATYFNRHAPALIRTLVTGGATPSVESQLAEEDMLRGGPSDVTSPHLRHHAKMAQLPLSRGPLANLSCGNFQELFCKSLDAFGILCLGLYRLLDAPNLALRRYVITSPPWDFPLQPFDRVFCLVPFSQSHLLTGRVPQPSNPGPTPAPGNGRPV
ncbi:calcium-activated potassium channel subunit alpha-1-like [Acipenser ruthenus]|uniref:calcium-activated potassium channel subunit alpha-1-like n=1 Tax=Acipenser ruthenus TaxID=7906 RepID=UPI002740625A|nr:calcium-activated potassium channel subunit alpha-1-like [Acipenser ruthenus]